MNKKNKTKLTLGVGVLIAASYLALDKRVSVKESKQATIITKNSTVSQDNALLFIEKNDTTSLNNFINTGGSLHSAFESDDGKSMTVAEGIVFYGRTELMRDMQNKKLSLVKQDLSRDFDVLSLAVSTNNTEAMKLLLEEKPILSRVYGKNGTTLMHMASAQCSEKMVQLLYQNGLKWNTKAKDGTTALTVAAENSCLPVLSYFRGKGANFNQKDGRGKTALELLRAKKDAESVEFTRALLTTKAKKMANLELSNDDDEIPNFYKKKKLAKFRLSEKEHTYEPEDRPAGSYQTADFTEFSD